MTSSRLPLRIEGTGSSSTGPITVDSSSAASTIDPTQAAPAVRVLRISAFNRTDTSSEDTATGQEGQPAVERVYPHLFDDTGLASQCRISLSKGLADAQEALQSFGEADLESVGGRLALVAAAMSSAHPLTTFNESLGGLISFIRRSTLTAPYADITRSALNALVHVLHSANKNPMLDLDEASDLVELLANEGWRGDHKDVSELISTLLDDVDFEVVTATQGRLFSEDEDDPNSDG